MAVRALSSTILWPSVLTSRNAPSRFDLIHLSIARIEYTHPRTMAQAFNWPVAILVFVSWALAYAYVSRLSRSPPVDILLTSPPSLPRMRVSELWPLLAPAASPYTLGQLAAETFDPSGNEEGVRLLTVGFNASAWMHSLVNVFSWRQAGTGRSHEMDIIFRRLSALSRMLLHPYFVFDGPDCPQLKRGEDVVGSTSPRLLVQRFQELLLMFGFNWHTAPGEAEAELACLQSCKLIDVVVTPYNDTLLFGATRVVRSDLHSGRFEDMQVYSSEAIEDCAGLEWGDLLLIMLMSSVDDDTGCRWCSEDVACQLVRYGFGRTLFQAAITLQFVEFMEFVAKWRNDVCEVLRTDPQRLLGRRYHELARIIKEERIEFPDPAVLAMYLLPLTSWSDGGHPPVAFVTSRQPNLASLATFCSQRLGWSLDTIQSRLIDASAGAATRALLQFPGNVDGEGLRRGLRVISHFDKPLPTYRLSVPSWPLAMPVDVDRSPVVHMSPLSEDANSDAFYEIEVPAVVLEYSRPDLVHDPIHPSSQSSRVQLVDEDAGRRPFESIVNLVALSPDAGVIDLTGGEETQTGVVDLMSED